jgi:alkylation response protein AidB-like acyl-CoA dehydrogenase
MSISVLKSIDCDAVEAADALVSILQKRSAETELARSVPEDNILDLRDAGLTRMGQPKYLGGHELPFDQSVAAISRIARGCASTAWVCGVYNDHAITIGMFNSKAAEDIWGDNPDALVSAGFSPSGEVERTDGGWQLSGTWGWSSGCDHADWLMVVVMLPEHASDIVNPSFCLIPKRDVKIDDNWQVMGLAGTGSKNIIIENAYVPDHRTFSCKETNDGSGRRIANKAPPLFCLPRAGVIPFMLAAPSVGVAESCLKIHIDFLKMQKGTSGGSLDELSTMQMHVAEASAEIDCAKMLMQRDCQDAMAAMYNKKELTIEQRARCRRDMAYMVMLCRRAVNRLFTAAGGKGIFLENEMQRKFRDINAISAHFALNWDVAGTTYGKISLGLEADGLLI